jgi:hypothetical protein
MAEDSWRIEKFRFNLKFIEGNVQWRGAEGRTNGGRSHPGEFLFSWKLGFDEEKRVITGS